MFGKISGIPAHPLLIHAAVVLIPLLILGAVVYAVVPRVRSKIGWAVVALAVIAPLAAVGARQSGENLEGQLQAKQLVTPQLQKLINQHYDYGNNTFLWTIGLGVVTLVLVGYHWQSRRNGGGADGVLLRVGSSIVMIALGAITGYYVFKTGDTGAHMVWAGL